MSPSTRPWKRRRQRTFKKNKNQEIQLFHRFFSLFFLAWLKLDQVHSRTSLPSCTPALLRIMKNITWKCGARVKSRNRKETAVWKCSAAALNPATECMKVPKTSSVYRCSCERAQRGKRGDAKLTSRISYLLSREKPGFTLADAQLAKKPAVFFCLFFSLRRVEVCPRWEACPDVAGGRSCSVVSMWMEKGGRKGGR